MTKTRSGSGIEIDSVRTSKKSETDDDVADDSDNKTSSCGKCNNPVLVNMAMICDGFCQQYFHSTCVGIEDDVYHVINDLADFVKWFCSTCQNKLDMLFNKSGKPDNTASNDWPTILNVVLDQLEIQGQNNLGLCKRMDVLTQQYSKISDKLNDVCSKYDKLTSTTSSGPADNSVSSNRPKSSISDGHIRNSNSATKLNANFRQVRPSSGSLVADRDSEPNLDAWPPLTFSRTVTNRSFHTSKGPQTKVSPSPLSTDQTNRSYPKQTQYPNLESDKAETKRKPILGTKTDGEIKLKAASKKSWIFVSRLDTSISKDNVEEYLVKSNITDYICIELKPKYENYKSFKIGVNDDSADLVLNPDFWDEGVLVKEFVPPRSRRFLGQRRVF